MRNLTTMQRGGARSLENIRNALLFPKILPRKRSYETAEELYHRPKSGNAFRAETRHCTLQDLTNEKLDIKMRKASR